MTESIWARLRAFEKWGLYGGEPIDRSDIKEAADRGEKLERMRSDLMEAIIYGHPKETLLQILEKDKR